MSKKYASTLQTMGRILSRLLEMICKVLLLRLNSTTLYFIEISELIDDDREVDPEFLEISISEESSDDDVSLEMESARELSVGSREYDQVKGP